jgi:hypothetical protein
MMSAVAKVPYVVELRPVCELDRFSRRASQHSAALDDADESFWRDAGYAARFEASIELSLSLHRLRHPDEPAPRFGRDAFGVRRR